MLVSSNTVFLGHSKFLFVDDHSQVSVGQGQHADYDFKGGAGGATSFYKQRDQKTGISHIEEQSPKPQVKDDLSDDENKDFMNATPLRHSARTAGKTFKYWSCYFISFNTCLAWYHKHVLVFVFSSNEDYSFTYNKRRIPS